MGIAIQVVKRTGKDVDELTETRTTTITGSSSNRSSDGKQNYHGSITFMFGIGRKNTLINILDFCPIYLLYEVFLQF